MAAGLLAPFSQIHRVFIYGCSGCKYNSKLLVIFTHIVIYKTVQWRIVFSLFLATLVFLFIANINTLCMSYTQYYNTLQDTRDVDGNGGTDCTDNMEIKG